MRVYSPVVTSLVMKAAKPFPETVCFRVNCLCFKSYYE